MDINKLRDALMGLKGETPEIPFDTEANQREAIEQSNEDVSSPYMAKKPTVEPITPIEPVSRDIANDAPKPPTTNGDNAPQPSAEMMKYKALIEKMEAVQNAPKKEAGWQDYLPDALAGLHNIANYNNNQTRPNMKMDHLAKKEAGRASAKKEEVGGLKNLQEAYQKYMALQNKDKTTPYQKAMLDDKKLDRENALNIAKAKAKVAGKENNSEFTKALHKKQASDFASSEKDVAKTSGALSKIDEAIEAQLKYTQGSLTGTGPVATLGGLTKYMSTDTENLEAKFKAIDLKNMVSTFSGMSKAVDSEAERQAWKATQASVSNDDSTNMQILLGSKSSMLKDRAVAQAKAQFVKDNGNLDGFTHPVLEGEVTTLVAPNGQMQLVSKSDVSSAKKKGYRTVDEEASALISQKPAPHGDIVEQENGTTLKWNPRMGKYQILK